MEKTRWGDTVYVQDQAFMESGLRMTNSRAASQMTDATRLAGSNYASGDTNGSMHFGLAKLCLRYGASPLKWSLAPTGARNTTRTYSEKACRTSMSLKIARELVRWLACLA